MGLNVFSDEQIDHIAGILFRKAVVNQHKEDAGFAGKVNWAARARELWESYKKTDDAFHGIYLDYVNRVRTVVRTIEEQGCEIRIVQ